MYKRQTADTTPISLGDPLDGALNGLRIWTQALTDAEILSHAQAAGVA